MIGLHMRDSRPRLPLGVGHVCNPFVIALSVEPL